MRGYTLVEAVVVIGIMALLSGAFIGYGGINRRQLALVRDHALVDGALYRARSLSIQRYARRANACAFGVIFETASSTFSIYEDRVAGIENTFGCRDVTGAYRGDFYTKGSTIDENEVIERFVLDPRLEFGLYNTDGRALQTLDVLFIPPDPIATTTGTFVISTTEGVVLPVTIAVRIRGGGLVATTTISAAGFITNAQE